VSISAPPPGFLAIGQPVARRTVLQAAASGRLQHTLLIHGPVGAGKGAFLEDLLALLLCSDTEPRRRPCNACRACRQARTHSHPDLVLGSPERWRELRSPGESIVAVARRWLLENAGTPVAAPWRVIVLEHADRANEQIQNALLKILEEPAPRQMFVLLADEPARLLPTIRSRAQSLRVGPVPRAELAAWLTETTRVSADDADATARLAGGLIGRALELVRDADKRRWWEATQRELLTLLGRGPADRFASARDLLADAGRRTPGSPVEADAADEETTPAAQRGAAVLLMDAWLSLARDLLVAASGRPEMAPAASLDDEFAAAASRADRAALRAFVDRLEETREAVLQNAAPLLALQSLMLAWPRAGADAE
jgi:DNA polymerase-3 subunit delta'